MPELSDALHSLFEEEARVQVSPSRAMNVLTGEARTARRRSQLRVGALAACGALVLGVGVTAGAMALMPEAIQPGGTPTASPTPVAVTWFPSAAIADATDGADLPACGDPWAPTPTGVGDITALTKSTFLAGDGDDPDELTIVAHFETDGPPKDFLADAYSYVVTQNGVVVAEWLTFENLNAQVIGDASPQGQAVSALTTCAAEAAIQAVWDDAGTDPEAELSDEEREQIQPLLDEVYADHRDLPSGTYKVYAVTPVIFGEPLAAAMEIKGLGVASPGYIESMLGETQFAKDPRIAPYCTGNADSGLTCSPPEGVLREVLTFQVDSTSIDTTPSGIAISEPITVTVP